VKVPELTYGQLCTTLAHAMKVKNALVLDWELCGKLIEKEKNKFDMMVFKMDCFLYWSKYW